MTGEVLNVVAAAMSAVAALAALAVAWLSLRDSRRSVAMYERERAAAMDASFQARLDPLYPDLRRILGRLDDGVPEHIRHVLLQFFVLYSDCFAAYRDGLLNNRDWRGLERELAFWAQKPTARRAWAAFSRQEWTDGFAGHMDAVLTGPAAYPNLSDDAFRPADVAWEPDDEVGQRA